MRKLSLLLGTLGGATAGYLFSNKKLREELSSAKDAEAAARVLGKHLQRDGRTFAKQIQDFIASDDVQRNLTKAKEFAKEKMNVAKKELQGLTQEGFSRARRVSRTGAKKAVGSARKAVSRIETKVRKLQ